MLFSIVHNLRLNLSYGGCCNCAFFCISALCDFYITVLLFKLWMQWWLISRVSQLDGQGPVSKVLQSRGVFVQDNAFKVATSFNKKH